MSVADCLDDDATDDARSERMNAWLMPLSALAPVSSSDESGTSIALALDAPLLPSGTRRCVESWGNADGPAIISACQCD